MSKFKVGNPWKTGKTNSKRKGIWATNPEALKQRDHRDIEFSLGRIDQVGIDQIQEACGEIAEKIFEKPGVGI